MDQTNARRDKESRMEDENVDFAPLTIVVERPARLEAQINKTGYLEEDGLDQVVMKNERWN